MSGSKELGLSRPETAADLERPKINNPDLDFQVEYVTWVCTSATKQAGHLPRILFLLYLFPAKEHKRFGSSLCLVPQH